MAKVEAAKPVPQTKTAVAGATGPKKEKAVKVAYPGLFTQPTDGSDPTPLKVELVTDPATGKLGLPTDYDAKKHQPLKRTDFKDPGAWYELRAQEADAKAAQYRQEAVEARATGSGAERAKLKRMKRMQDEFAKLREDLEKQGINVDAFLKAQVAS